MYFSQFLRGTTAILVISCLLSACNSTPDTVKQNPETGPVESNNNAVESVEIDPVKFTDRVEDLSATLFEGYKEEKMQQVDHTPRFKEANQSVYRKFRMKKPIKIELSSSAYPRLSLKAFRFAEERVAWKVATRWLNSHEHSEDSIALGSPIAALKTPPHFCAVRDNELYLVQTSCIYQHATYDKIRDQFKAWTEKEGVDYAWEITCAAGKVEWFKSEGELGKAGK